MKNPITIHLQRFPTSVGIIEALAGVDPQNKAERVALWDKHRHLYTRYGTAALAVMADCKKVAASRLARGEFSLYPRIGGEA